MVVSISPVCSEGGKVLRIPPPFNAYLTLNLKFRKALSPAYSVYFSWFPSILSNFVRKDVRDLCVFLLSFFPPLF